MRWPSWASIVSASPTPYRRTASSMRITNRLPGLLRTWLRLTLAATASSTSFGVSRNALIDDSRAARVAGRLDQARHEG